MLRFQSVLVYDFVYAGDLETENTKSSGASVFYML